MLSDLLRRRVLVLDGAMGTLIQTYHLGEDDYRGDAFAAWPSPLCGCNDVLCLTRGDVVADIHRRYVAAGADIITTNTFGANRLSLAAYGLQERAADIARAGAGIARAVADEAAQSGRTVLVAGSIGPTGKSATISPDADDPAARAVTYDALYAAFREQAEALIKGGADVLIAETSFDTLNAKALLAAVASLGPTPLILSLSVAGKDGRVLSGQTVEAFAASTAFARPYVIGLNCGLGAAAMQPLVERLAAVAPCFVSAYPNAGLPNALGLYDQTPEQMAAEVRPMLERGTVNIIGGCCGTTPEHIRLLAEMARTATPRAPKEATHRLTLAGLDTLTVDKESAIFVNVGERCNVAGSRKFLRLVKERNYDEALRIARGQVEAGAQVIDINMDDALLDAAAEMEHFVRLIAAEPDIARVPLMIDTSDIRVALRALKSVQGKAVVNSISLKTGEQTFLENARRIHQLGAAMVVMAFDEDGQACTFERKTAVCARAYQLLTAHGIPPEDIIFDPNILTIATGMAEHDRYAADFIRATAWIKHHLPHAKVSGGVSNLSFAFRGNNYLREAMHAVFLYHAIKAGMDMAIVNPATKVMYDDIAPDLRQRIEDAVLATRPDAATRLIDWAANAANAGTSASGGGVLPAGQATASATPAWRTLPLDGRLAHALAAGTDDFLADDIAEALQTYDRPVQIIEGPLMDGMRRVGRLFGEGKMFLPQVVKTARTMKHAVDLITGGGNLQLPEPGTAPNADRKKILLATVRGDVHDIGKNIVGIVLACNGYDVEDLGVMVPPETIVEKARAGHVAAIGLSGLITPSLHEMAATAEALAAAGIDVPLMVGGAATSPLHTALKIAPKYRGVVVHVKDASQNPIVCAQLFGPNAEAYIAGVKAEQAAMRAQAPQASSAPSSPIAPSIPSAPSPARRPEGRRPRSIGRTVLAPIPLARIAPYINWRQLLAAWRLPASLAWLADEACPDCQRQRILALPAAEQPKAREAAKLLGDAHAMLNALIESDATLCRAVVALLPARRAGEDIIVGGERIPMLRSADGVSLADFLRESDDWAGAFAITAGLTAHERAQHYEAAGDNYAALLLQSLTHSLAEGAAEWLHEHVRKTLWGYAPDERLTKAELFKARYQGIRPAVGYPSLPDQTLNHTLDRLLHFADAGITLTPNGAMSPTGSVSGLYFAAPEAHYFMVGRLSEAATRDYAERRGIAFERARELLANNF